jgi:hypothetical protein
LRSGVRKKPRQQVGHRAALRLRVLVLDKKTFFTCPLNTAKHTH